MRAHGERFFLSICSSVISSPVEHGALANWAHKRLERATMLIGYDEINGFKNCAGNQKMKDNRIYAFRVERLFLHVKSHQQVISAD